MTRTIHGAKGQSGILAFIFGLIIFFIAWVFVLAKEISVWTAEAIANNSLTGAKAFLIGNMNLWIALFMMIAVVWFLFSGGNQ
jgi:hypothetical protein